MTAHTQLSKNRVGSPSRPPAPAVQFLPPLRELCVRGGSSLSRRSALSLIEIMVAVTLLSLIVIGLLAVFNHTSRALRAANNQTDVFEGARAVVDLVERDLAGLTATSQTNVFNVYATNVSGSILPGPGGDQTNYMQDLFLISRENDRWFASGYFVDERAAGIGTLYRFSTNGWWFGSLSNTSYYFTNWWKSYTTVIPTNASRILDGVVHFEMRAYDEKGRLYTPQWLNGLTNRIDPDYGLDITNNISIGLDHFTFSGQFLPAYIDMEIGMLEPQTLKQFNVLVSVNPTAAQNFLKDQLGKVHLFRQRIPVRNHMKPEALD